MMQKDFKTQRFFLSKGIIKNYIFYTSAKNFVDQATGSDKKRYNKSGKLTTRQGEDQTTGYLSDYEYLKIITN